MVPAATTTLVPLRVTPALVVEICVVVTADGLTTAPFSESFTSTLLTAVPPVYPLALPESFTATICCAVTVTMAESVHPRLSVTFTTYVPAARLVAVAVVWVGTEFHK